GLRQHGDVLRFELRAAHAHPHALHNAVFGIHPQGLDARAGLHVYDALFRHAALVHILRHAADAVAAHLADGTVRVIHIHLKVGLLRGADADKSVAAHAEMSVRDEPRKSRAVLHCLLKAVYIHIVVATAVHLRKLHIPSLPIYGLMQLLYTTF